MDKTAGRDPNSTNLQMRRIRINLLLFTYRMKILFFGDVVGRVGRHGVRKVLPKLREQYQPDIVIANAENIAHGIGITPKTIEEMVEAGVDFFTSGNHVWKKQVGEELLQAADPIVIRPANYLGMKSGIGYKQLKIADKSLLVINLEGRGFMWGQVESDKTSNPFVKVNEILSQFDLHSLDGIFVDFHAETTSEKTAMGWHLDGRVSAVVGTHTHIPTADARILPQGTAYQTDIGMCGARNSVIGVEKEAVLKRFLEGSGPHWGYAEEGDCDVNAVFIEIGDNRQATKIESIHLTVQT